MKKNKRAIYAGTFDPYTNGHHHILSRALRIFDEVVVLVAVSPTKKTMFSKDDRIKMLQELYADNPRVSVDSHEGLIVDYAKNNGIQPIVRGLRPTGDFEIEFQMASMNYKLNSDLDTVFLMTGGRYYFVSSTLVKEVFGHGGDISEFVPESIHKYLKKVKK